MCVRPIEDAEFPASVTPSCSVTARAVSELEAEELVEAMREAARELEGVPPE